MSVWALPSKTPSRARAPLRATLVACAAWALACSDGGGSGDSGSGGMPSGPVTVTRVAEGLSAPVSVAGIPGDERLFILLRSGRILILELDEIDPADLGAALRATPLLDISAKVDTGGERGLLGMAFDPEHPFNGLFYLYYNDNPGRDSQLSRFEMTADPNIAYPNEDLLFNVDQQQRGIDFSNHKGGSIAFSPNDGHLYWALGDGGSGNDPNQLAQDGTTHLGKMLRLDVGDAFGDPVMAPADNPFVGFTGSGATDAVLDEIWGIGLRNPFRFSFDWQTGDLWIGDVGQGAREEIDFEAAASPGGLNWGWDVREGDLGAGGVTAAAPWWHGPAPGSSFSDATLFDAPIHDYPHAAGGCGAGGSGSVTGGIVYRGPFQDFDGLYFFGDFCTGRIWSLDRSTTPVTVEERTDFGAAAAPAQIVAFGEDGFGAMYVVHVGGAIYRIGPSGDECANGADDDGDGAADLADSGCGAADDPSELDSDTACDDGFDNDADGNIDRADTECVDSLDDDEST